MSVVLNIWFEATMNKGFLAKVSIALFTIALTNSFRFSTNVSVWSLLGFSTLFSTRPSWFEPNSSTSLSLTLVNMFLAMKRLSTISISCTLEVWHLSMYFATLSWNFLHSMLVCLHLRRIVLYFMSSFLTGPTQKVHLH